ncbi:MAG: hypothetical protein ACI3V2_09085 [Faecousia sp.]
MRPIVVAAAMDERLFADAQLACFGALIRQEKMAAQLFLHRHFL